MNDPHFRHEPDPDRPGWMTWDLADPGRYNDSLGPIRIRREGDKARCRIFPERRHSNLANKVHGGIILGLMDVSLFAGAFTLGVENAGRGLTVDCSVQFLSAGRIGEPLDAVVEMLRETGRLVFLRGTIEQGDERVAAFSGVIRKLSPGK